VVAAAAAEIERFQSSYSCKYLPRTQLSTENANKEMGIVREYPY
jgi:hypothetical protein